MEPYQELERQWAEFNDLDPAGMVGCASGTAALHLAFEALKLPQGSEVIVPDFCMYACARAVALAGLKPVFVDCKADLNINPALAREAATNETAALLLVHNYGRVASFGGSLGWPVPNHIHVIEDLAEAHGVKPHPQTDAACWSFYRNKIVAGEEGGAVWLRDPAHAKLARQLRSLGFTDAHDFTHIPRGHNYRLSNAHAGLILKSLENYGNSVFSRRRCEYRLGEACPVEWKMPLRDAPWVYDFRIPGMTGEQQDAIVRSLQSLGIPARHAFKPLSAQEEFRECRKISGAEAEKASREVIYLPLSPDVAERAGEIFRLVGNLVTATCSP